MMRNYNEWIEPYLNDELSEKERLEFEQAVSTDLDLAQSVKEHQMLLKRLNQLRLRTKVKTAFATESQTLSLGWGRIWTIAAAFILLLGAAFWLFQSGQQNDNMVTAETPSPNIENQADTSKNKMDESATPNSENKPVQNINDEIPSQVVENQPNIPKANVGELSAPNSENKPAQNPKTVNKSPNLLAQARTYHILPSGTFVRDISASKGGKPSLSVQAAQAFEAGKYAEVNEFLSDESSIGADESARFLRAHARFQLGLYVGAVTDFNVLRNSFQYKHEARWGWVLSQIGVGQTDVALKELNIMRADKDYPYQEKAAALLEQLK